MLYNSKIELTEPTTGETLTITSFKSINISKKVDAKVSTFSFSTEAFEEDDTLEKFQIGCIAKIYTGPQDGEMNHIFTGYVNEAPRSINGIIKEFEFRGEDLLYRTQSILVNTSYVNTKVIDIIKDLMEKHALAEGLYIKFIQESEYTLSTVFQDEFLYDILEKLADSINFTFEVDLDGGVSFYENYTKENSMPIRANEYDKGSASFSFDKTRLCNFLRIYGGMALSTDVTQTIIGDGQNYQYKLNKPPRISTSGKVEIIKNGIELSTSFQGAENSDGVDVLIQQSDGVLTFKNKTDNTDMILTSGDIVKVTYRYEYQLYDDIPDSESISIYGKFADKMDVPTITDRASLRAYGKNHLKKYSKPLITGSIETWKTDYSCGEVVLVDIETRAGTFISENLQITSLDYNIEPNVLRVSLGFEEKKDLADVVSSILQRLAELEKKDTDTEVADVFTPVLDNARFQGNITITEHLKRGFWVGLSKVGDKLER